MNVRNEELEQILESADRRFEADGLEAIHVAGNLKYPLGAM